VSVTEIEQLRSEDGGRGVRGVFYPERCVLIANNLAYYQNLLLNFVHPLGFEPVNRVAIFRNVQFRKINNKFAKARKL
jgi:hypothetical protein